MSADRIICPFQGSDDIPDSCTARQSARTLLELPAEEINGVIDRVDLKQMATELPRLAEEVENQEGGRFDRCLVADNPEAQLDCNRNPFRNRTVTYP